MSVPGSNAITQSGTPVKVLRWLNHGRTDALAEIISKHGGVVHVLRSDLIINPVVADGLPAPDPVPVASPVEVKPSPSARVSTSLPTVSPDPGVATTVIVDDQPGLSLSVSADYVDVGMPDFSFVRM